jgi:hypothetical protein
MRSEDAKLCGAQEPEGRLAKVNEGLIVAFDLGAMPPEKETGAKLLLPMFTLSAAKTRLIIMAGRVSDGSRCHTSAHVCF